MANYFMMAKTKPPRHGHGISDLSVLVQWTDMDEIRKVEVEVIYKNTEVLCKKIT